MTPQDVSDAPTVSARVLADRVARGDAVTIVDVRDRDEFETWRIDGPGVTAHQIPYSRFVQAGITGDVDGLLDDVDGFPEGGDGQDDADDLQDGADRGVGPVVVVCAIGEASAEVATQLEDAGYDAVHLEDGMAAWSRLLTSVTIETDAGTLVQYDRPSSGCLSYLLVSGSGAVVVDPLRAFTDRYARDASEHGADIKYAIDTHVHADHVSGVRELARGTDAEPVLPEGARERGLEFGVRPLAAGERLAFGDASVRAIGLPGHTTEMTGLEFGDVLLAGDSVFVDGVARPDLEAAADADDEDAGGVDDEDAGGVDDEDAGGVDDEDAGGVDDGDVDIDAEVRTLAERLHRTVTETIGSLPGDTRVFPGHHAPDVERASDGTYATTVDGVHATLDRIGRDRESFVESVLADTPRPNNFERIVAVNLGRERVDDETAFELELGPNNCAAQ
jgi:rhodanese-related sulfurtransferase